MMVVNIGKWLIRLTGFVTLIFGGVGIAFSIFSFALGLSINLNVNLSLIFSEFHYYTENVLDVSLIAMTFFLSGAVLSYIGFWKIEHNLW